MIIEIDTSQFEDKLSDEQLSDIIGTLKFFCQKAFEKYAKGAIEHGGNIWDMTEEELEDEAFNEAVDLPFYLITKMKKRWPKSINSLSP